MKKTRKNKFEYNGIAYKSGHEQLIAHHLTEKKVPFSYEPCTIGYSEKVNGGVCLRCGDREVVKFRKYLPDFVSSDGKLVLEAKGRYTPAERRKMLNVIRSNPTLEVIMVFQHDNWLTKKKKRRYSDWCRYNNILYSVGSTLPEWVLKKMGGATW